jgi:hypothetical protein
MADTRISALTALGAAPATGDLLPIVDISDTTHAASGTTKKLTIAELFTGVTLTSPVFVTPTLGAATGTSLQLSGLTASEILATDASKNLVSLAVATYPSLAELIHVKGVTSAIQTQLNTKAPSTAPTFATSITGSYLTASEILITDSSKNIVSAAVATYPSLTELTYLKGVTSAIQTQLNLKATLASPTFTGTVTIPTPFTLGAVSVTATGTQLNYLSAATGTTGTTSTNVVFSTSPTLVTPVLGAATATSINGLTITSSNGTLTVTNGKTLSISNTLTFAGTDGQTFTFPNGTDTVVTLTATQELDNKTLDSSVGKGTWTASGTWTLPAFTAGGVITLAENSSIALDPAGSADGKYSGTTVTGTGGATIAFGDLVYLDPTDSRWELCDANAASGADGDSRGIIGMAVTTSSDGAAITVLLHGIIRADAVFPAMTINAPMYISETAGDITGTKPTTTDAVVRPVGFALTADELFFNPDPGYQTAI